MKLGRVRAVSRENALVRFTRRIRPDRNPLRRASDKLETYLLSGAIVTAIAAAPFAVPAAAAASHAAAASAQAAELASRHQVSAVLLQRAAGTADGYSPDSQVLVQATWRSADGAPHAGQVMAPAGAQKGSSVLVWTDRAGNLSGPPLTDNQIAGQADLAGATAAGALVLLVLCEGVIIRRVLDRRRMAAWDAEWSLTGPMWNRQRW